MLVFSIICKKFTIPQLFLLKTREKDQCILLESLLFCIKEQEFETGLEIHTRKKNIDAHHYKKLGNIYDFSKQKKARWYSISIT